MNLSEAIPDAELLIALDPEELGLKILPTFAALERSEDCLTRDTFIQIVLRGYPAQSAATIKVALVEAWAWLEGAALLVEHPQQSRSFRILSRRARRLAAKPDPVRAYSPRRLPKEYLHARIREDVWADFHRGKYETAVFEAMREVEIAVREGAGFAQGDYGVPMIRRAFHKETGPLRDPQAEEPEKEAVMALFAGAIGSYKNPHSHRHVPLDNPDEAVEIIMLANHLLRIVDARVAARTAE